MSTTTRQLGVINDLVRVTAEINDARAHLDRLIAQRRALYQRGVDYGMSVGDIAATVNVTPWAVRRHVVTRRSLSA